VHALVVATQDNELPSILKSWKGVSARKINQLRRATGNVWQKESYDHIVRNAEALERIRKYILNHKT
jgi:REP element-mobilizing transposase RayT